MTQATILTTRFLILVSTPLVCSKQNSWNITNDLHFTITLNPTTTSSLKLAFFSTFFILFFTLIRIEPATFRCFHGGITLLGNVTMHPQPRALPITFTNPTPCTRNLPTKGIRLHKSIFKNSTKYSQPDIVISLWYFKNTRAK